MPYYDFICKDCGKPMRLFFSFAEYETAVPVCPHCQSKNLKRRISRVALGKSEESRLDSLMDDSTLDNLDESDPQAMGRFMRQMSQEMGEDLGDEFNEVVGRLEKGESPESIEKSMPELGDINGGLDDF
jgi:putative FmdB family regulatory protein